MIVTTTNSVEGCEITAYLGIVTGEAVSGINMFRDIGASVRNIFGGRSAGYEEELQAARTEVLGEMEQRATALGADAIVGARIGYETFEGMIMTCCSGTAVKLRRR
uniref:YbjQ family protein n=1 Tax=Olsenella timonensis TaxID=1805478 RepID=UPI00094F103C|nr:YbjQ family protein [Olsenella timonensis]